MLFEGINLRLFVTREHESCSLCSVGVKNPMKLIETDDLLNIFSQYFQVSLKSIHINNQLYKIQPNLFPGKCVAFPLQAQLLFAHYFPIFWSNSSASVQCFTSHQKNLVHLESCCCCVFMRGLIIFRGKATQECTHEKKHTRAHNQAQPGANYLWGFEVCVGGKAKK